MSALDTTSQISIAIAIISFLSLIAYIYFEHKKERQYPNQLTIIEKIDHPTTVIYMMPTSEDKAKKLHFNENVGFVRDDQSIAYTIISSPKKEYQELILKLKPYIAEDDLDILLSVSSILKAEEEKLYFISKELHFKLKERYKVRGLRIYNLMKSEILQEKLISLLSHLDKICDDTQSKKKLFDDEFKSILKTTHDRIWVSHTGTGNLKSKIKRKIEQNKLNELWVYSSGNRDDLNDVEKICKTFVDENKDFILEPSEEYHVRDKIGKTFKIIKVKANPI